MPSLKLKATFEEGQNAALCDKTLDDCPYRRVEKRNAWVRGFHEGKLIAQQRAISPVTARTNQGHIAHLRSLLTTQH